MPAVDGRRPTPRNETQRKTRTTQHHQQSGRKILHQVRKGKSQTVIIGNTKERPQFTLGQMTLDLTTTYKYLGEMINGKTNLKDQITQLERKLEAAYQTILAIAGDRHFRNTQIETIWKLVTTCLIPIITYGGETTSTYQNREEKLNQMLDSIIKIILMVPTSTPKGSTIYRNRAARHRNYRWQKQNIHGRKTRKKQ